VMASDLPDIEGYRSSTDMARVLSSYMDDADKIRARILEDFDRAPSSITIDRMRRDHLASLKPAPEAPHKPHEGYYPADVSESAAAASKRFIQALERERAISNEQAKAQGALDSPALRQPDIVNQAWDRETERAWLQNTELRT
jgi:hypothetical protein